MSLKHAFQTAHEAANTPSLANLAALIRADTALPPRRQSEIVSALRSVARALGSLPDDLPADPATLRKRLHGLSPAMAGTSKANWANVISRLRFALEHAGITRISGRSAVELSPEWLALSAQLPTKYDRFELSRFFRYCQRQGITPADVDDAVLSAYRDVLQQAALVRRPGTTHRTACIAWNKAVGAIPSWPQRVLTVPSYRNHYYFPWESFPASLKQDVDAYLLDRPEVIDPWGDCDLRRLKPQTIHQQTNRLRGFASALVHKGFDPASLRKLADLVTPEAFEAGLKFLIARAGGKHTRTVFGYAHDMQTVARHHVKLRGEPLESMKRICKLLKAPANALTAKNRSHLRQFDDEEHVQALLALPDRIFARVGRVRQPAHADLLEIQSAIAVALLLALPLRLANLVGFDIRRHLQRERGVVRVAIPADRVKNGVELGGPLPAFTVKLLDVYLTRYRPLLPGAEGSPWLIPGPTGEAKSDQAVRKLMVACILRHTGLAMTPHLFRHLAVKIYTDAHPGEYEVPRLMLGHHTTKMTATVYAGSEMPAAMQKYAKFLTEKRRGPRVFTGGRKLKDTHHGK